MHFSHGMASSAVLVMQQHGYGLGNRWVRFYLGAAFLTVVSHVSGLSSDITCHDVSYSPVLRWSLKNSIRCFLSTSIGSCVSFFFSVSDINFKNRNILEQLDILLLCRTFLACLLYVDFTAPS